MFEQRLLFEKYDRDNSKISESSKNQTTDRSKEQVTMSILTGYIGPSEARQITEIEEGQFAELKSLEIEPAKLTRTLSAFANSDGGELYIGIDETEVAGQKVRSWRGFSTIEKANGHLQAFEKFFPLGTDFDYLFMTSPDPATPGFVLQVLVRKTADIRKASNNIPYIRRGAQNLPVNDDKAIRRLEYTKGLFTFETELTNVSLDLVTESQIVKSFITRVVPRSTPEVWLRKQLLIKDEKPAVAGVLLFSDEPQAILPKRCGIKIYRYKR